MSKSTIRNLILSLILIAGSVVVFGTMIFQVIAQGEKLDAQIVALEEGNAKESSYRSLQRDYVDTADERSQLENHFLSQEGDSINFLNKVEELAPQVGVVLETKGLDSLIDRSDEVEWIEVTFSFFGTRERIQQFIEILETFPLVSRVVSVDMESMSSKEWQAELTMQVRVFAYDE